MDKDKTKARRVLDLIVLAAIVVCVALVLVELAANVGGELLGDGRDAGAPRLTSPGAADRATPGRGPFSRAATGAS